MSTFLHSEMPPEPEPTDEGKVNEGVWPLTSCDLTMTYIGQWKNLAARIDGLIRAGEFLASAISAMQSEATTGFDYFDCVKDSILPERASIIAEITQLGNIYASELPPQASAVLHDYIMREQKKIQMSGVIGIQSLAPLASFRSQFEYLIRDAEAEGRSLTELAFEHLRRQIVVDNDIRGKWQTAFNEGNETDCEKLGAVHLLSHGIWAFKVVGTGAATDLVFNEPVKNYADSIRRTARALVLTEWKLVKDEKELLKKARVAREQAKIYSGGVLGDSELKRTRYVILVCGRRLPPLEAVIDGAVIYCHILLPTSPEVASKEASNQVIRGT